MSLILVELMVAVVLGIFPVGGSVGMWIFAVVFMVSLYEINEFFVVPFLWPSVSNVWFVIVSVVVAVVFMVSL